MLGELDGFCFKKPPEREVTSTPTNQVRLFDHHFSDGKWDHILPHLLVTCTKKLCVFPPIEVVPSEMSPEKSKGQI